MARRPNELFDKNKVKKLCDDVILTPEHIEAAVEWLTLLKDDKLKDEEQNKSKFERIILERILGYTVYDYIPEKDFVDYIVTDKSSGASLCIERKGTSTESLDSLQKGRGKEHETPIKQIWVYMGLGHDYGICTNYNEFAILLSQEKTWTKSHRFKFESIADSKNQINEEKLREFIGLFSKKRIFEDKIFETLSKETVEAEEEFTEEFYKLYHETRLMLIKEFTREKTDDESKKKAIHWAQIFLNRLIFIFFVEDHNFIPHKIFTDRLINMLQSPSLDETSNSVFENINELFKRMNSGSRVLGINEFNGGLFAEEIPSELFFQDLRDPSYFQDEYQNSKLSKKSLAVDLHIGVSSKYTETINPIIKNFLIMDSYDFTSDLNVNILGHIFEQSISDLERISKTDTANRKKFGVYYTPEPITDYICRNTIIPYLSKRDSETVEELVKEYENGLDQLEEKIKNLKILDPACGSGAFLVKAVDILLEIDNEIQKYKPTNSIIQKGMDEHIKTKEINNYIENNIYGVDINEESIEITKLSLFLKLAGPDRKLSYLSDNIKVGNSLIADLTIDKKNSFFWEKEFPEILNPLIEDHGIDIIIGNPPYVQLSLDEKISKKTKEYLISKYKSSMGRLNTFGFFIVLGINLMKENGRLGYIVPNTMLTQDYYGELREKILETCEINSIVNFSGLPFKDAVVENVIPIIKKTNSDKNRNSNNTVIYGMNKEFKFLKQKSIPQINFTKNKNFTFGIFTDQEFLEIKKKITEKSEPLSKFLNVNQAIALKHDRSKWVTENSSAENAKPLLVGGKNIDRYSLNWDGSYLKYDLEGIHSCKTESIFTSKEKIIFRRVANRLIGTLDTNQFYGLHTLVIMNLKPETQINLRYFLGIFNSKLMTYFYKKEFASTKSVFSEIGARQVEDLPIKIASNEIQEKLIEKTESILNHHKEILEIKKVFQNRITQNLNLKEIPKGIDNFAKLKFKEFIQKLKKQKAILRLSEQDQWEEYFNDKKASVKSLEEKIHQLENQIDEIIYDIYDLNSVEIQTIESSYQ